MSLVLIKVQYLSLQSEKLNQKMVKSFAHAFRQAGFQRESDWTTLEKSSEILSNPLKLASHSNLPLISEIPDMFLSFVSKNSSQIAKLLLMLWLEFINQKLRCRVDLPQITAYFFLSMKSIQYLMLPRYFRSLWSKIFLMLLLMNALL